MKLVEQEVYVHCTKAVSVVFNVKLKRSLSKERIHGSDITPPGRCLLTKICGNYKN